MTINFLTDPLLNGRRDESDLTNYPYATFADRTSTLSNNGTPMTYAKTWKDFDGFRQRIIAAGKITPTGDADTATASQIYDGLMNQYGETMYFFDAASTEITALQNEHSYIGAQAVVHLEAPGDDYALYTAIKGGGIEYGGLPGGLVGDRKTIFRVAEFDATGWGNNWTKDGDIHNNYSDILTLTGVPHDAVVYGGKIKLSATSGNEYSCHATFGLDRTFGSFLRAENFLLLMPNAETIDYNVDPVFELYFNPVDVD